LNVAGYLGVAGENHDVAALRTPQPGEVGQEVVDVVFDAGAPPLEARRVDREGYKRC
jgi:hypothetical protein